jgi:hypothetical protein
VRPGDRVVLIDDLIATGGTMMAGMRLLQRLGAQVIEGAAIVDLPELQGSQRLRAAELPLFTVEDFCLVRRICGRVLVLEACPAGGAERPRRFGRSDSRMDLSGRLHRISGMRRAGLSQARSVTSAAAARSNCSARAGTRAEGSSYHGTPDADTTHVLARSFCVARAAGASACLRCSHAGGRWSRPTSRCRSG